MEKLREKQTAPPGSSAQAGRSAVGGQGRGLARDLPRDILHDSRARRERSRRRRARNRQVRRVQHEGLRDTLSALGCQGLSRSRWCLALDLAWGAVPTKRDRHTTILELIDDRVVASQEELRRLLLQRGWDVTQSTLSRDVHELRLARVPTADGGRYVRADGHTAGDDPRPALETVVPQLLRTIDGVGELLLLRTSPGSAHTVALAMDAELPPDVIGTVAGDDTILVVCRSVVARERLARRLRSLARTRPGRPGSGGERGQG